MKKLLFMLAGILALVVLGAGAWCIRFWDKECVQKVEWILNQKPVLTEWHVELAYIEDEEEWNRAVACCRLAVQAGIQVGVSGKHHPVNPTYREEICALLHEFGV